MQGLREAVLESLLIDLVRAVEDDEPHQVARAIRNIRNSDIIGDVF